MNARTIGYFLSHHEASNTIVAMHSAAPPYRHSNGPTPSLVTPIRISIQISISISISISIADVFDSVMDTFIPHHDGLTSCVPPRPLTDVRPYGYQEAAITQRAVVVTCVRVGVWGVRESVARHAFDCAIT